MMCRLYITAKMFITWLFDTKLKHLIYIYFFIVIHNHYNNVFRAVTGKENSAYKRRKKQQQMYSVWCANLNEVSEISTLSKICIFTQSKCYLQSFLMPKLNRFTRRIC